MVRITAVFIAGILTAMVIPGLLRSSSGGLLFIILLALYYLVRFSVRHDLTGVSTGILGLASIFIAGYWVVVLHDDGSNPDHLLQIKERIRAYEVKVVTPPEEKEKSWKRSGELIRILTDSGWKEISGRINLYWPKSEPVFALDYGDRVMVQGMPLRVAPPLNPGEFDLKRFLEFKHIYHQHFIRSGTWTLFKKSNDRRFLFYAHRARNWSVAAIKKFIESPREQAIVAALVLGVTDGLDSDLRGAYAANGAMHVLAVSGLHVSIIYGILLFFFRPLGKIRGGPWIIAVTSLVLLWAYAFITGLSPSVLRAVAMFSFVAVAKPMNRVTNIYNTLSASAFFLLLYDPFLITSVGFQLSYLAVLGIVYLQRPIYNLWEAKTAAMDWVWQISCVSVAAQIATIALTLFYFHQFPVYFLLSNLFVIPGSFVVLVGGILLLIISPVPVAANALGMLLEWFVRMVNEGVFLVERLPCSLIDGIYISSAQCLMMFAFLISGMALIRSRKFRYMVLMAVCVVLFSLSSWRHFFEDVGPPAWIVYAVRGHEVMEWTREGRSLFLADSSFAKDVNQVTYHVTPHRLQKGIQEILDGQGAVREVRGLELFRQSGKTWIIVESRRFDHPTALSVDYVIIRNNSIKSLQTFAKHVKFDHVIFDSSNSSRYCDELEKEAKVMNVQYHTVLRQGAYTTSL